MPVGIFKDYLERTGSFEKYLKTLEESFNSSTRDGLTCRHFINIGWDGALYNCDFNQVLGLHIQDHYLQQILDFDIDRLAERYVRVDDHCYGYTAGQGST